MAGVSQQRIYLTEEDSDSGNQVETATSLVLEEEEGRSISESPQKGQG